MDIRYFFLHTVLGVFIDLFRQKGFNRSNVPTIVEAVIFSALGVCMLLFGRILGNVLELLIYIEQVDIGNTIKKICFLLWK